MVINTYTGHAVCTFSRAMISILAKEIRNVDQFQELCKVLLQEHCYNELARNMQIAYCILKYENDILEQQNYQEILHTLRENNFFDNAEEKMLLEDNSFEIVMTMLKNKCLHYFMTFLLCLKALPGCSALVHKIESNIADLNDNFHWDIPQHSPQQLNVVVGKCPSCLRNTALHYFQQYFRQQYKSSFFTITGVLDAPKVFYINLALIIIDEKDEKPDFLDYDSLLFKQENSYSKILLTSLSQIFIENQRVILIQGSPGSGKTTLAKKICREWVEGRLLQDFTHVVFVELRDTRVPEATSLGELISLYMGNLLSESIAEEITKIEGKGVLFLLEGWDELSKISSLFTDLITGKLLPGAIIVITSRPSASGSLSYKYIRRRIEILGFTKSQVEEYINKYFQGHDNCSQVVQHVLSQLESSPRLKRLIFVPVNLSIVLFIFKQNDQQIPQSYTALYETFLRILLNRYQEKKLCEYRKIKDLKHLPECIFNMLQKLGKLAYYELLRDKMIFTEELIQKYCFDAPQRIPEDFDGMGLLHVSNSVYHTHVSKTYHFVHRTLQELLAAWYLSQQPIPFQHRQLQHLFDQKRLEMVWIFYGGLTKFDCIPFDTFFHKSITQSLKILKNKVWSRAIHYAFNNKIIRFSGVNEILATYFATEQYSKNVSNYISREFQTTLMAVALEVENPSLCKIICNSYLFNAHTCWFTVPDSAVTPQILLALSYCISHSEKNWIIQCKTLDNDGASCLLQHLTCNIENCDHKTCFYTNCIRMLDVYSSPEQIDGLLKIIHHQNSLEYIVLSRSASFDDGCVLKLAEALCNNTCVKLLHLLSCNLAAEGIRALAEMLKCNTTLEWIALRDNMNTLEEESILSLMDSIYQHNDTLYMLVLDSKFHENSAVQLCLQKINSKRKCVNKHELCIKLIDCARYSQICQRLFTLQ